MRDSERFLWVVCSALISALLFAGFAEGAGPDLIEKAKRERVVEFYGSISTQDAVVLIEGFEKKYPFLKVKHFRAGSDTLLEKILIEAAAGRFNADVYNLRAYTANVLLDKGLFGKYVSPNAEAFPEGFKHPEGYWTSIYMNPATIGYNAALVSPDEAPKNWADLLDPKWKGQLGMDQEESEWFANMLKFMGREYKKYFDEYREIITSH